MSSDPVAVPRSAASPRAPTADWTPEDWKRVFVLLDRALEIDEAQRDGWLAALAASQPDDAAALATLLDRHAALDTSDFLDPATRHAATKPTKPAHAASVEAGLVGPYRLLREIGRGGTATVWLAERADGLVDRRVALKRPELHAQTPDFIERVRRERSILASLDHPNIARLYDAGFDPDGRSYLALEYIDGLAIDAFADNRQLSMRERVALVRDVARAVAYAHAQLVVHRDLKPSNLLVDAHGVVHLVDFGIAKLIEPTPESARDAALDQPTMMLGRALTPNYASPEQVRGEPIGTASDIYSLGVVAFELFAGERPYRLDAAGGVAAMAEALARADVPQASSVARDAERARALRGDLDAILQRMLGPRPADRYATMNAVVDDLERHLDGSPVAARGAARGYILRRWIARHRIECGIVAALAIALAAGAYAQVVVAAAMAVGAVLALWQRDSALKQAALARVALERGEQVKNFIASIFTQAVPRTGLGGAVVATDLLKAAAKRVETDLAGQPDVAAELGVLIGSSFNELGDMRAAVAWLPKAVALANRQLGPTHPLSLQARRRWVEAANTIGDLSVGEAELPSLLRDLRAARPPQTKLLVEALQSRAFVDTKGGRRDDAVAALHEAIEVGSAREGEASPIVVSARVSLSNTLMHVGDTSAALAAIEPAMASAYALYEAQRPHLLLTAVERCYGDALAQGNRPRDATLVLRQVVADQRTLDVEETTRVRMATSMLARAYFFRGAFDVAASLHEAAAEMHDRLTGGANLEGVSCWYMVAMARAMAGDAVAATAALARSDGAFTVPPDADGIYVGHPLVTRALVELVDGRPAQSLATLERFPPWSARVQGHFRLRAAWVRSAALLATGRPDEARRVARNALDAVEANSVALDMGFLAVQQARAAQASGDTEGARASWQQAMSVWNAHQVDDETLHGAVLAESGTIGTSARVP